MNLNAERTYTDEEKAAFLKIWNTGKSIALIGVDDKLREEVKEILAHQTPDQIENNAYIYLMGLATGSKTPYETGLDEYQSMLEYKNAEPFGDQREPRPGELHVPDIELTCQHGYEHCYRQFKAGEQIGHNDQDSAYLNTYLELIQYQHYQQVPQFLAENTSMQLRYVAFLQKYFHQAVIQQAFNDKGQLIDQLLIEHQTLKSWLVTSKNAMPKLFTLQMFNRSIDILSFLIQKRKIDATTVKAVVTPFTEQQMSLKPTLMAQRARNYRMLMAYNDRLYGQSAENDPILSVINSAAIIAISKPNLSLNNDYTYIVKPLLALDELDAQAFKNQHQQFDFKVPDDKIRNTASGIHQLFIDGHSGTYLKLKTAFFELNMKIQLLQAITEQGTAEKVIEKAQQGYTPYLNHFDQSAPFIKDGKLCYDGLSENNDRFRCLNIIGSN
ncbi:hypothetical protein [Marinicella marina]|uniref:hypothetical protein n=1 Tax=Marinicella marina TaxID=2996016 RepID=UPI002260B0DF|nr:hypothetical protein [Marinicella marina]